MLEVLDESGTLVSMFKCECGMKMLIQSGEIKECQCSKQYQSTVKIKEVATSIMDNKMYIMDNKMYIIDLSAFCPRTICKIDNITS